MRLSIIIGLIALCYSPCFAQSNQLSLSFGGGKLISHGQSVSAPAFTLAYSRNLTSHIAAEGSLDAYWVSISGFGWDGYDAAQAAIVLHILPVDNPRRIVPYVTAGIGKVTTDFTEIPSERITRFGAGVKYFLSEDSPFGIRVEFRDERTKKGIQGYPLPGPDIEFVSIRAGIVWRF